MKRWYAVHTQAQAETKALFHLNNQNIEAYLPYYLKTRRHARRVDKVKAPLFSRYLFVHMDIDSTRWRAINSTCGVNHVVCRGELPAPIPEHFVEEIKLREDTSGAVRLSRIVPLKPGEKVRIVDGLMADQIGVFECECDEDRVIILLNILGRATRVTAPSYSVVTA